MDRLVREVQTTAGVQAEITYQYDALDRRISRTLTGVVGETTTYGYDPANRLRSMVYRGETTTFDYDPAGRLRLKTLPNGIRQELTYDDADRLLAIVHKNPDDTVIDAITYRYDANGRRIAQISDRSPLPDAVFTAVYDDADRMTAITFTATGETFDLGYDEDGNLATKAERGVPGNVTLYAWDSRNRLTSILGPGVEATFDYDALDRRIARTVNGRRTDYIYDGLQVIGELTDGRSIGLLTGLGIDEVIARYPQAGSRYYLTDALNTVIAQTRADRSIQNSYLYSAWGETTSVGPDESNPIQYTARENDGTGLYHYRARYYDPRIKRFLSEDPIGIAGGVNLYTYVGNDPVSLNDPLGLDPPPKKPINLFPPNLTPPPEKPPWACPRDLGLLSRRNAWSPVSKGHLSLRPFPRSSKGPNRSQPSRHAQSQSTSNRAATPRRAGRRARKTLKDLILIRHSTVLRQDRLVEQLRNLLGGRVDRTCRDRGGRSSDPLLAGHPWSPSIPRRDRKPRSRGAGARLAGHAGERYQFSASSTPHGFPLRGQGAGQRGLPDR